MRRTIPTTASMQEFCAACHEVLPLPGSVFCIGCSAQAEMIDRTKILLHVGVRFVLVFWIEFLFGIFAGLLVFLPLSAIAAPNITPSDVVLLFGVNFVLIAPILASIYTWTLRAWINDSLGWALVNTVGALLPGALMFASVGCGLRFTTMPFALLSLIVVIGEGCIGISTAWIQRRYLLPSLQDTSMWLWSSIIGWSLGSCVHMLSSFFTGGLSLWVGSALGYLIAGLVAHSALARFAIRSALVEAMQYE